MQGKHPHSVHSYSFIAFGPVQKSLELNIAFLEKLDFRTRVANATHNFAKSRLKLTIEDLIRVTLIVFDAWRLVWRGLIDYHSESLQQSTRLHALFRRSSIQPVPSFLSVGSHVVAVPEFAHCICTFTLRSCKVPF